jgi:hypothetical protein
MSKKHISYPKIAQFRNIISTIRRQVQFVGLDLDGNPIYDSSIANPILTFTGTVKLHGTNAGVCYNETDGLWYQSRNRILTVESDNAGFAFFADSNKKPFENLIRTIAYDHKIDLSQDTISIYGEWAGRGIQKGVAISELERAFYIFGVKVSPIEDRYVGDNESSPRVKVNPYWIDCNLPYLKFESKGIYNIYDFPTYSLDINIGNADMATAELVKITEAVEAQCPVAALLGSHGVGEGVVWSCDFNGTTHRFKVKGDKHSVSKVKKLAPVNTEKLIQVEKFVDYSTTQNRLDQACQEVFGIGAELDIKKLGDVIRWMIKDINTEEADIMTERNLFPKDVNKYISRRVAEMFKRNLL